MSESEPKYGVKVIKTESSGEAKRPYELAGDPLFTITQFENTFKIREELIQTYKEYVKLLEERYLGGYGDDFKDISELRNKIKLLNEAIGK